MEEGASITGLRESLQYQFKNLGIPSTIFLYIMLTVQVLNVICVALISCMYKNKRPHAVKKYRS